MTNELKIRMQNVIKEIESLAHLIRISNSTNEQEVIDYENELNKYSNIDYLKMD